MFDHSQQTLIELQPESALVLAGPGCGKTHILASRVFHAHAVLGVPYEKMLCLTFTNRAAREMTERVENYLGNQPAGLFVGNLHRFCLQFLFANELIHPDTTILDDEDAAVFAAEKLGITQPISLQRIINLTNYLYQKEHGHPKSFMRNPGYEPTDTDLEDSRAYVRFKIENQMLDFDDILLRTCTALLTPPPGGYKMCGYTWIQVDEVQDLTSLQLGIIDLVSANDASILYLGDEQQSIFGFRGAGGRALDAIKQRCTGWIFHLQKNYRSPRELVELCNDFALNYLGVAPEMLPESVSGPSGTAPLREYYMPRGKAHVLDTAFARRFLKDNPKESTAILVRTNRQGQAVSEYLKFKGLEHICICGTDLFRGVGFKTLWSHLALCLNPVRRNEWARILYQTKSIATLGGARKLMRRLVDSGICGEQLLHIEESTDVERLACALATKNNVVAVIDTETTGLDIFHDDVVQIAAVKIRDGIIDPDSRFNIYIHSQRKVPATIDGKENPLKAILESDNVTSAATAFSLFSEYLSDVNFIAGHNLDFDIPMLCRNYIRHTGLAEPDVLASSSTLDTLRLARLLYPRLRSHRLGYLIDYLNINGSNSHNALDDACATANLLTALLPEAQTRLHIHSTFREDSTIRRIAARICDRYGELYHETRRRLFNPQECADNTLAGALYRAYLYFIAKGSINAIDNFHYLLDLVNKEIIDPATELTFRDQLMNHLRDLLAYNEGDLFAKGIVREQLSVMTIHKAKGLEMDNVIIHDASSVFGDREESCRLLYVAFSRARRRLYVGHSNIDDHILGPLTGHFVHIGQDEVARIISEEERNNG